MISWFVRCQSADSLMSRGWFGLSLQRIPKKSLFSWRVILPGRVRNTLHPLIVPCCFFVFKLPINMMPRLLDRDWALWNNQVNQSVSTRSYFNSPHYFIYYWIIYKLGCSGICMYRLSFHKHHAFLHHTAYVCVGGVKSSDYVIW